MAKKYSLIGFLRSEVAKHRIQPPCPSSKVLSSNHGKERSNLLLSGDITLSSDSDSLFCTRNVSSDVVLEERLKDLLSQSSKVNSGPQSHPPSVPVNSVLQDLKDELKNLVYSEEETNFRQRALIQRQRFVLIGEISRMEEEEKVEKVQRMKAKYWEQPKTLPEPIDRRERRRLGWNRTSLEKARLESVKQAKRARKQDLEDLDGEDLQRLGLAKRRRATKLTGHWNSTLHESFLGYKRESESCQGKERMALRQVSTVDEVLQRRGSG